MTTAKDAEAEALDELTPIPINLISSGPVSEPPAFPPETGKYMTWATVKFLNSPTSHILDLTCAVLIGALILCGILSSILQIDVTVKGPAEITVDGGVREVVSPIDGLITKILKKNGDTVKEQELIARIQIDEEGSAEVDSLLKTIQDLTKKVEEVRSPAVLAVQAPEFVKSSKIYDSALLQAVANIEHAVHDFQLQKAQFLLLNKKKGALERNSEKTTSEIYYVNKRIAFLSIRLRKMKASANRELLASYIDSTEEEIGRLKNQVITAQLRVKSAMDQGYADLLRSLRIAIGSLNDFKQHHEVRSPINGVIGRIIEGDNEHVVVNRSIATIIPSNSRFIAKIKMKSDDIVRLKKGQRVFFKVDAYPFQRYGLFTGTVTDFNQVKDLSTNAQLSTGQPVNGDDFILYATIFPPEKVDGKLKKPIKFIFGMQAEATVVMERKSISNILIDKFFKLKDLW